MFIFSIFYAVLVESGRKGRKSVLHLETTVGSFEQTQVRWDFLGTMFFVF